MTPEQEIKYDRAISISTDIGMLAAKRAIEALVTAVDPMEPAHRPIAMGIACAIITNKLQAMRTVLPDSPESKVMVEVWDMVGQRLRGGSNA